MNEKEKLKSALEKCSAVLIGAGAGLSAAAGFAYSGERMNTYFGDFSEKYGFRDMYAGGFFPYATPEEHWAYWSRYIYINRYMNPPYPVYNDLLALVKNKDYFVLTTNVDHCFQKAGFDKTRLFYTQGDFGLWQCGKPCHKKTYGNREQICAMLAAQGFAINRQGTLIPPAAGPAEKLRTGIPTALVPHCPKCGEPMTMNLRADDTFVEDSGWHSAAKRYAAFLDAHKNAPVMYLELGVGFNTPVIIKYPFWNLTAGNQNAVYVCINYDTIFCPKEIEAQAICIKGDIREVLQSL